VLLAYLNDWDHGHRDSENWLVETNSSALAGVFQSVFKEGIVSDSERLAFWLANREKITRPVYITAMLNAMLEIVKERNFDNLEQWIEFCSWLFPHSSEAPVERQPES
jgi:hypothetical protein